jgi:hypothetical protein
MMGLGILGPFFLRALPPCLVGALFLFVLPRKLVEWRMVSYILLFVLVRDLMTPLGIWEIHPSTAALRLPGDTSVLVVLGALTGACVVLVNRLFTLYEGSIAAFVRMRSGVLASTLTHGGAIFLMAGSFVGDLEQ